MHPKKRLSNRGQITPFIIIGIVLLILVLVTSYMVYTSKKSSLELKESEVSGPRLAATFSLYVRECIEKEGAEPMKQMGMQGGGLWPTDPNFLYYNRTKVNYLCYAEGLDPAWSCVNSMLTKGQMEFELSYELKRRLQKCINLGEFKKFVSEIKSGEMNVNVKIAKDDVAVTVDYPVNMTAKDSLVTVSEFTATLDYPLGRLYSVAESIVNKETSDGYFDIDEWMNNNGADMVIEKHRPYPDTVYVLRKDNYTFQFAVQGLPSAGQFSEKKDNYYGCCIEGSSEMCFKNTDPLRCVELAGEYNPNVGCSCTSSYGPKDPCTDGSCSDCTDIGRQHSESWCEYDTITGKGYDYVGSRHYKYSCINGSVYIEECRDYREELCTEEDNDGKTKAVCRPNRWASCSQCTSETCCEDQRQRDCYWDSSLDTDSRCVPQVPPGLRFWNNEGAEVCLNGNQEKSCEGLSCSQSWIDSAARYCYSQGDCGNYRNINDDLSTGSFYETDILKKTSRDAYTTEGMNTNPGRDGTAWKLNLGLSRESSGVVTSLSSHFDTISLFVASISNFFDQIASIDPSSFLNPFVGRGRFKVKDFSVCNLWIAPAGDADCSLCFEDSSKPCTEYRCRSLGENCLFEMDEGVPICRKSSLIDFSPPSVEVDLDMLPPEYTLERVYLSDYEGYRIIEPVRPHKPFTFGVKTDEDTRCTVSLTPRIEDYSLQTVMLGDSVFRRNHNLTIRIPPRLVIPDKLSESINISSEGKMLELFYNIKDIISSINDNLMDELEIYSKITGSNLMDQIQSRVDKVSDLVDRISFKVDVVVKALLTQFDRGGYYLFFDCTDRAGNRNQKQVFLQFTVDYGYVDEEAPIVVAADPINNGRISPILNTTPVKIYLDEPAECRYDHYDTDYSLMNYSFSCPSAAYQLSPVAGGTYECLIEIDVPFSENRIFIRCSDNPPRTESYTLRLYDAENPGIAGLESLSTNISGINASDYIAFNGSEIDVPAGMLDEVSFGINSSEIGLNLYVDDSIECRYSQYSIGFDEMADEFSECMKSEDLKKGVYICSAVLNPETRFDRSLGNYTLNIELTQRNKTVDANPDRIIINNGVVYLNFDEALSGHDSIELSFSTPTFRLNLSGHAQCSLALGSSAEPVEMACSGDSETTACERQIEIAGSSKIIFECTNETEQTAANQTHYYNIKCRDTNMTSRNTNTESYEYVLSKADELKIINISPSGVINTTSPMIMIRVSEDIIQNNVQCGYNDNPYSYLKMERTGYRLFEVQLPGLEEDKEYTYYIRCSDKYGTKKTRTITFRAIP